MEVVSQSDQPEQAVAYQVPDAGDPVGMRLRGGTDDACGWTTGMPDEPSMQVNRGGLMESRRRSPGTTNRQRPAAPHRTLARTNKDVWQTIDLSSLILSQYTTNNGLIIRDSVENASSEYKQKYNTREKSGKEPDLTVFFAADPTLPLSQIGIGHPAVPVPGRLEGVGWDVSRRRSRRSEPVDRGVVLSGRPERSCGRVQPEPDDLCRREPQERGS